MVDFLHGDYEKQETTENLTTKIIKNSKDIMNLLNRDNISLTDIEDYHMYPIADNDSPKLSADRLEYTLSDGLVTQNAFSLEAIERIYNDLIILKNENDEDELGFKNLNIAEEYVERATKMWHLFSGNNENNIIMQFWTDIIKRMTELKSMKEEDLYKFSEKEIVDKIKKCQNKKITEAFKIFENTTKIGRSEIEIKGKYCISIKTKKRYTNPLVLMNEKPVRIENASKKGKEIIKEIKEFKDSKYAFLNIDI